MGKSTPAHRAGAPTARGRWVSPRPVGESAILIATGGALQTARARWVDLRLWRSECRAHPPGGSHPLLTSGGCSCTVGRGGFPHRYKPSSLLRLHIADTSALPMLELGLMPVVTTLPGVNQPMWMLARELEKRRKNG